MAASITGCSCGAREEAEPIVPPPTTTTAGAPVELPPAEAIAVPLATRVGYTALAVDGLVGAEVGLAITDAGLVVIGGERLVVIAGDGTTRVVDNPEGFEGYSQGDSLAPIAAGAFLHFGRGDRLVAREVSSLATRFVYAYEWDSLYTPRVYASGDHFIVRTRTTWIGIDARSGVEVWRTPLTEPVHGIEAVLEAAGHGIVVEARRGFVLGLDASTGREIFRRASTFEEPGPIGPHGFGLRFMPRPASATTSPSFSTGSGALLGRRSTLTIMRSPFSLIRSMREACGKAVGLRPPERPRMSAGLVSSLSS